MGNLLTATIDSSTEQRTNPVASPIPSDADIDRLVGRARSAQREIEDWSETRIDALLCQLAGAIADRAHILATATVAETGMGNVDDKALKNLVASASTYAQLAGQTAHGEMRVDRERRVVEIASPVGVVVGLVPATHPVATFIFKVLIALKGRNAIILSPSRRARRVSQLVGGLVRDVLREHAAPPDLVQWLGIGSTRETTTALMSHPHVGLVLATGGRGMVRAAYRSGTPAIGVGPGNAPVLINVDADLAHVAESVVASKSFDNGLICGAENHLVVPRSVRAQLLTELIEHGAAILADEEQRRFRDVAVDPQTNRLFPAMLGQNAASLARLARVERPYHIRLLVAPAESITTDNYLAAEKLAPLLSLFTVADTNEGLRVARALLDIDGAGHTAVVHTTDVDLIERFATTMPASRVLVNSPATQGLMGLTTGLDPSWCVGCGTWGGNSTTNGVTFRDLLNIKRVAYCLTEGA